uniref:O-acetyl-ADP-ribose deacetylase C6orf130 n=1 Tax=Anthurium amnicola TaxID=1678845 RepID=A0A1D1XP44_9ARAE
MFTDQSFQVNTNKLNTDPVASQNTTPNNKFIFEEIEGNLFADAQENSSLAHCVSEDFKMGKGIAKIFKHKYQGVEELVNQHKKIGQTATLKRGNRYIFYIITKKKYYQIPKPEDFELALWDLRKVCEELNVKHLSLPRIGTGLDKFPLEYVINAITKIFEGCDMRMTMFYL